MGGTGNRQKFGNALNNRQNEGLYKVHNQKLEKSDKACYCLQLWLKVKPQRGIMQKSHRQSRENLFLLAALGLLLLFFGLLVMAIAGHCDDFFTKLMLLLSFYGSYFCCLGAFLPYWKRLLPTLISMLVGAVGVSVLALPIVKSHLWLWQAVMLVNWAIFLVVTFYAMRYLHGWISRGLYCICITAYAALGLLVVLGTMT